MTDRSVAEIKAELAQAQEREQANAKRVREQTPVVYKFTIKPVNSQRLFDRMYDDTCKLYEIRREVQNRTEAQAVGHHEWELRDGGMRYVYNTKTTKIVCSVGGGTSYISPNWNGPDDEYDGIAFDQIARFIVKNPDGGDITDIVKEFQEARGIG